MVRSAITLCTLILVTTAACSSDIDTYKQSVWSDEALDGVLDELAFNVWILIVAFYTKVYCRVDAHKIM